MGDTQQQHTKSEVNALQKLSLCEDAIEASRCCCQPSHFYIMAVGTGGGQMCICPPPPIFVQPQKLKSFKIPSYKSVHSNKAKIGP